MSPYIIALFLLCATNIKAENNFSWSDWLFNTIYHVEYQIYSRNKPSTPDILTDGDEDALNNSTYERREGTVVYIHSWLQAVNNERSRGIIDAYLQLMDCNVILINWDAISTSSYFLFMRRNVEIAGRRVANMMKWLEAHNRLNISDLHIIGMSLGAQVAGFVGKALEPQKVRRITGLDPASPLFEGESRQNRLDKSDANFVDLIHTSYIGVALPYGHADFYLNFGKTQPGCLTFDVLCSHFRVALYFIESILNPNAYPGRKCTFNYDHLENCEQNISVYMGHHVDSKIHGVFSVLNTEVPEFPQSFSNYFQ